MNSFMTGCSRIAALGAVIQADNPNPTPFRIWLALAVLAITLKD